jgi:hypothetical protein
MGWAARYIEQLKAGQTVSFRAPGGSMSGKIENRQLCTVVPVTDHSKLQVWDIVLCKVRAFEYLHLIKAIQEGHADGRFQIGNNRGGINGWIGPDRIYGICVKVEP